MRVLAEGLLFPSPRTFFGIQHATSESILSGLASFCAWTCGLLLYFCSIWTSACRYSSPTILRDLGVAQGHPQGPVAEKLHDTHQAHAGVEQSGGVGGADNADIGISATQQRACTTPGYWGVWAACTHEGCTPGTQQTCATCGAGTQVCQPDCTWAACSGVGCGSTPGIGVACGNCGTMYCDLLLRPLRRFRRRGHIDDFRFDTQLFLHRGEHGLPL
jgi:hypothetical protein